VTLSVVSFKYYRNGAGKVFLAGGIFFLLVFLTAVAYIIAAVLLLSGIE
jgi:hypothetical protein